MQSFVKLTTGEDVPTPIVAAVMLSLSSLFDKNPIAVYELVQISRDPMHELWGNVSTILQDLNLLEDDGQPHEMTRMIVLAAVEGEGIELKLVSPILNEQEAQRRTKTKTRDLGDRAFYALTREVANIILAHTEDLGSDNFDKPHMQDRRHESPNPFYNQTADGLYLELYYGTPSSLWTPWGKWEFGGSSSGSWEDILSDLLERFGATPHQQLRESKVGAFGPVYALHKVDNTPLPDPVELDNAAYTSYEEVKAAWAKLAK